MATGRSGYVLTTYLIDTSNSMSEPCSHDPSRTKLQLGLEYVKARISDQILRGLKTEHAAVILFGNDRTDHDLSSHEGYENINEIIKPDTADTHMFDAIDEITPSKINHGDILTAMMMATAIIIKKLGTKHSWRRELILVTDGKNETDWQDIQQLRDKLIQQRIDLVVSGLDFDDEQMGFVEPGKDETKQKSEQMLNILVNHLEDHGIIGNTQRAYEAVTTPSPKIPNSAPTSLKLRLGDPENDGDQSLAIDVISKKATAKASLLSLKKMIKNPAKIKARQNRMEIDQEERDTYGLSGPTSKPEDPSVPDRRLFYYHLPEEEQPIPISELEENKNAGNEDYLLPPKSPSKKPKPQEQRQAQDSLNKRFDPTKESLSRDKLVKAYKFGTTRVSVDDISDHIKLSGQVGIDILGFLRQSSVPPEYRMGELEYVYASPDKPESQVAFSAFIWALAEQKKVALTRMIKSQKSIAPKLGILYPCILFNGQGEKPLDLCYWVRVPFMEDVRKYSFPSLELLYSKSGKLLDEHANLPTNEMQDLMDEFVDSMDLMEAGEPVDDESENVNVNGAAKAEPWMNDVNELYNPALHNLKNAIIYRMSKSIDLDDGKDTAYLPEPHPALTKYFDPPESVMERSKPVGEKLAEKLNVKKIPPKISYKKGADNEGTDTIDLIDILGDDGIGEDDVVQSQSQPAMGTPSKYRFNKTSPQGTPKGQKARNASLSQSQNQTQKSEKDSMEPDTPTKASSVKKAFEEGSETEDSESEKEDEKENVKEKDKEGKADIKPKKEKEEGSETEDDDDESQQKQTLISESDPIGDFNKLVESGGDVYTEIMQGMSQVIPNLIRKSFSTSQFPKAIECMRVTRKMAAEMDEAETWNEFVTKFKETLKQLKHGKDFWNKIKQEKLGLLSKDQVIDAGVTTTDLELGSQDADEFLQDF